MQEMDNCIFSDPNSIYNPIFNSAGLYYELLSTKISVDDYDFGGSVCVPIGTNKSFGTNVCLNLPEGTCAMISQIHNMQLYNDDIYICSKLIPNSYKDEISVMIHSESGRCIYVRRRDSCFGDI